MSIEDVLTCPLSKTIFVEPITLSCCGTTYSRTPLLEYSAVNGQFCPNCNHSTSVFDVSNMKINNVIEKLCRNIIVAPKAATNGFAGGGASATNSCIDINAFNTISMNYLNKRDDIDVFIRNFAALNAETKSHIIDMIIFGGNCFGLKEDVIMMVMKQFYDEYNDFAIDFGKKFNKYLFEDNYIENEEATMGFANLMFKFCEKYYPEIPTIQHEYTPEKHRNERKKYVASMNAKKYILSIIEQMDKLAENKIVVLEHKLRELFMSHSLRNGNTNMNGMTYTRGLCAIGQYVFRFGDESTHCCLRAGKLVQYIDVLCKFYLAVYSGNQFKQHARDAIIIRCMESDNGGGNACSWWLHGNADVETIMYN